MQKETCQTCGRALSEENNTGSNQCIQCRLRSYQKVKQRVKKWRKQLTRSAVYANSSLSAFSMVLIFTIVTFGVTAGVIGGYTYLTPSYRSTDAAVVRKKLPTPFPLRPGNVTEFSGPSEPFGGITSGPDGNLWLISISLGVGGNGKIDRVTPEGKFTEFSSPIANTTFGGITSGPDGNLWVTEEVGTTGTSSGMSKIGRVTPEGLFTEFTIPTANSFPREITSGPDGNLWFIETSSNKIGRITPQGSIIEFPLPATSAAYTTFGGITSGPDGNLWFTETSSNKIGRITPQGRITEFPLPTTNSAYSASGGITGGPDGNLWVTRAGNGIGKIERITPEGKITEFTLPGVLPYDITSGPDGNLWFTYSYHMIGRISPKGVFTVFSIPPSPLAMDSNAQLDTITSGPEDSLWFSNFDFGKIGRISFVK